MTKSSEQRCGGAFRLSQVVRDLGYTGSPLPLDEWSKLRATIASMQTGAGLKRVNLPPVIVSCAQCGATLTRSSADMAKHERRGHQNHYCSAKCWGAGENIRRFGARVCSYCSGPAPKATAVGTPARGRVFCSEQCMEQARSEEYEARVLERMKPCARCNALFLPANSETQFCGRDCSSRAHAARMKKDGNPRWKDGASASRAKPHVARTFREMRPLVMRRDGVKCVLCEASAGLDVHHIDENPMNNRATNLVTLCRPCHMKAHFSEHRSILSAELTRIAETPMSTTFRWKKRSASSPTAS